MPREPRGFFREGICLPEVGGFGYPIIGWDMPGDGDPEPWWWFDCGAGDCWGIESECGEIRCWAQTWQCLLVIP